MEENEHKCPLCGKETKDGEIFCGDCREIAENEYPDSLHEQDKDEIKKGEEEVTTHTDQSDTTNRLENEDELTEDSINKNKKGRKNITIFIAGIILCVIVGAVSTYFIKKERQSKETEAAFWDNCIDENTTLSYSKYLVRYPDGIFQEEAQNKILELRHKEDSVWQVVSKSDDADRLYLFLSYYPTTPYRIYARQRIDSLTWNTALKDNTATSYKAYLDNITIDNYDGKYQIEAQEKYNYLSSLVTVDGDELKEIKKELTEFFKLLSSQKYKDAEKKTSAVLADYYGQRNKRFSQITDSLKTDIKNKKIRTVSYKIDADTITVIRDRDGIYFTQFIINKQTSFTNKKKKDVSDTKPVSVELNKQKQLRSITGNY